MRRLLAFSLVVLTAGAVAAVARADPAPSSNWAGYAVTSADSGASAAYTSVSGDWIQPAASCTSAATYSAFWVGLGGYSETSQALEQIGTESDCDAGHPSYSVWYELVPASSITVSLKVFPGNHISANVTVHGQQVIVQLKNLTRGTVFTKQLFMKEPDVSSAEWIAEAPSECSKFDCKVLPLANFGTVAFTNAKALASGHGGTIVDAAWLSNAIELSSRRSAVPSDVSPDGGSFRVTWFAR